MKFTVGAHNEILRTLCLFLHEVDTMLMIHLLGSRRLLVDLNESDLSDRFQEGTYKSLREGRILTSYKHNQTTTTTNGKKACACSISFVLLFANYFSMYSSVPAWCDCLLIFEVFVRKENGFDNKLLLPTLWTLWKIPLPWQVTQLKERKTMKSSKRN